ncbi:MAG: Gldg family protein [candidate division Zixibacteria bacterium]|nr:Gldg family protein [candidate division Zixibacteria bacterium]MBU1471986.1 Gldg family protein [candidate division Zixibacteria bacterium]MBU2626913.1 Gldg family protein [candidate division Zixibacteria bacterium]
MATGVKKGATASTTIIIVVGCLVFANLISVNLFTRADLTDSGIYSLSEASKELVHNLTDRVVIKCYFTEDLPPPYNQNARYLKDQLAEYRAYSGGKLQVEFVDPAQTDREQEAQQYRIPPVQVNAYESDRLEIKKVYMGMVFLYEDRTEVLPVLQSTAGLEYEISRTIRKITSASMPRIAFVTGHGESDLQQTLKNINQVLSREYIITPLDLANQTEIQSNIDAVLIVSPKAAFSEWELFLLDQYLMKGGKVGFFIDKFNCDIQNNSSTPISTGLGDLLRKYGVGINDDLVLDALCARIGVQQQTGFFRIQNQVEFRYFPRVTDFQEENVIVKGFDGLTFTFISSLDTAVAVPQGVQREILAWSSELSAAEKDPFNFDPFREFGRADLDRQHIPLVAAMTGQFPSYFSGMGIPMYTGTDTTFNPATVVKVDSSMTTRMIVVGDGDFAEDRNMSSQSNLVFFMNVVDWLSQDEGLISIRSKQVASRPLDEISSGWKRVIKYSNILAMPILVIMFGVIRWRIRKSNKKRRL